jgi:hypothetical protein
MQSVFTNGNDYFNDVLAPVQLNAGGDSAPIA